MRWISVALLIGVMSFGAYSVEAREVNGFAFWLWKGEESGGSFKSNSELGHIWLVMKKGLSDNLEALVILAPSGPPRVGHNLQLTWLKPIRGINSVTLGRFIPPFGWDWPHYRVDKLPTVFYSGIDRVLVARDNGIKATGQIRQFQWATALFVGHSIGGNIPISERRRPSLYLRGGYKLPFDFSIGLSQRIGPVNATGADVVWKIRRLDLTAELIRTEKVTEYYLLSQYPIVFNVLAVLRFEHAQDDKKLIMGCSVKPVADHEIKANLILSEKNPTQVVGQAVLRW